MNKMTCREKILSQDYWDFILPGDRGKMADNIPENSYCRQQMDFGYESVSVDKSLLSPLNIEEYWYNSIPNCYTLLDSTGTNNDALNSAGTVSYTHLFPETEGRCRKEDTGKERSVKCQLYA